MPRRADHEARRQQITGAVCRITVKGGLSAATFREVAAEAGVSVRLVQYYFGSKDELLLATQRHVAARSAERLTAAAAASTTPRGKLVAILGSFIPVDGESREQMLMFVALNTASLVDTSLARREARDVPDALHRTTKKLLVDAGLPDGHDAGLEASLLVAAVPSLAQAVLAGTMSSRRALRIIEYGVLRALGEA